MHTGWNNVQMNQMNTLPSLIAVSQSLVIRQQWLLSSIKENVIQQGDEVAHVKASIWNITNNIRSLKWKSGSSLIHSDDCTADMQFCTQVIWLYLLSSEDSPYLAWRWCGTSHQCTVTKMTLEWQDLQVGCHHYSASDLYYQGWDCYCIHPLASWSLNI